MRYNVNTVGLLFVYPFNKNDLHVPILTQCCGVFIHNNINYVYNIIIQYNINYWFLRIVGTLMLSVTMTTRGPAFAMSHRGPQQPYATAKPTWLGYLCNINKMI